MKSSTVILSTAILFILCISVLSFIVERELDPNYEKDWFAIGFIGTDGDAPDFVIENHSSDESFRFIISSGGKTLSEESFSIRRGETLDIHPDNTALPTPYTLSVFPEHDPKRAESLTRK